MQRIIVGIVSHGHFDFISKNEHLIQISALSNVYVVIKDNLKDVNLKEFAEYHKIEYLESIDTLGFGENNNLIFNHFETKLKLRHDDWFIMMNPDVEIGLVEFHVLIEELKNTKYHFFTPNLFKDSNYTEVENSIRYFPSIRSLFNPILFKPINRPYEKNSLEHFDTVEWASGAFLCIRVFAFKLVGGFDLKYFMYYEDVDFCLRLNKKGIKLRYLKKVKAKHKGEYKNRKLFSKHFFWYIHSLCKFIIQKDNKLK